MTWETRVADPGLGLDPPSYRRQRLCLVFEQVVLTQLLEKAGASQRVDDARFDAAQINISAICPAIGSELIEKLCAREIDEVDALGGDDQVFLAGILSLQVA